jgi:UDP-glucuronate 4-epimerase
MPEERFLVTGALGCIGAWTVRTLAREGAPVVAFDLGSDRGRLELIMTADELERVTLLKGDVTDRSAIERALDERGITHVIHLAALLIPLIKDDPPYGALVNVVGAVNVFEAVRRRRGQVHGVAYASSVGAYGPDDADPAGGPLHADARGLPTTHYGVHKQANEGTARIYWLDERVPSIGLRPYILYGPGRDTGVTAAPSLAMAAAARGEGYHIPFGGRMHLQYAPDVARAFIAACRAAGEGARVFNLGGSVVDMGEAVSAIEAAAPEASGRITFDDVQLPFPPEFESESLERALGPLTWTPLAEGVRETVEHYRRQAAALAPA